MAIIFIMERIEKSYTSAELKDELEQLVYIASDVRSLVVSPGRSSARFTGFKSRALEILEGITIPEDKKITVKAMIEKLEYSYTAKELQSRIDSIMELLNNKSVEIVDLAELSVRQSATMVAVETSLTGK